MLKIVKTKHTMLLLAFAAGLTLLAACGKKGVDPATPEQKKAWSLAVGDTIPEFSITNELGEEITDNSFARKPGLIAFFNTSCTDCVKELAVLQKVYDEYRNDVEFLLVSRNEEEASVKSYWEKQGYSMPYSAQADDTMFKLFASANVPRVYILADRIITACWDDDPVATKTQIENALNSAYVGVDIEP